MAERASGRAMVVRVAAALLALVLFERPGLAEPAPEPSVEPGPTEPSPDEAHRPPTTDRPEQPSGTPQGPSDDPSWLTGVEEPGREPGDAARTAADIALFVPRNVIDLLFRGTSAAAGLLRDQQIVPRMEEALSAPGGQLYVFPTMFVETGAPVSFGARMIARAHPVTTSFRVGYGIPEDVAVESRIRYYGQGRLPYALTIEGLYEVQQELEYLGVGQTPERDPRNRFVQPLGERVGLYRERKVRAIGSVGLRPGRWFEFFLSTSLSRRSIDDTDDADEAALSRVFEPETIPGAFTDNWIVYAEWAARLDTRATRGRPSPGALLEGYFGGALSTADPAGRASEDVAFMRMGGRAAGFFPIYRSTNILSPRLVIDRLAPLSGLPVPFTELPRQPDFRGFDNRRDALSLVGSVDYSWLLVDFLGARVFVDTATVAPSVAELSSEHFEELRWAVGAGLDLFITSDDVGQFAVSGSPDGVRVLLSIGVPSDYGDRQHRE